jgi:signal transduction histidine kinase
MLKNELIQAGRQSCEFNVVEQARSGKFLGPKNDTLVLYGVPVVADTNRINEYVSRSFIKRYKVNYQFNHALKSAKIDVNPAVLKQLDSQLNLQKRGFAIEAILLTLLIAAGIFGVYYSVNLVFELNKQQNNFLLSVTHELKTPIATIRLIGETILKRSLPQEKQHELLGTILENTTRLQDMTENMLTAMQMENNRYTIKKEAIDLSGLVNEVKQSFSLKNPIFGNIESDIAFFGDPILLKMTLNNLIENAIKYSDNQPVELNLSVKDRFITIEVKDSGAGIEPEFRKKVFRKFYRIQDEETRETKGSGLGLFIVKQAVEKHKGKIYISENQPKGSVFTVVLDLGV